MGWFDVDEHASGAVAGRLATDAAYLRGAVGDQIGIIAQNLVTCIAGFTLGALQTPCSPRPCHRYHFSLRVILGLKAVDSSDIYVQSLGRDAVLDTEPWLHPGRLLLRLADGAAHSGHHAVPDRGGVAPDEVHGRSPQPGELFGRALGSIATYCCAQRLRRVKPDQRAVMILAQRPDLCGVAQTESEFASANVTASESFSSIRTVAAFSMEDQIQELYRDLLKAPAKAASKTAFIGCVSCRASQQMLHFFAHGNQQPQRVAALCRGIGFGYSNFMLFTTFGTQQLALSLTSQPAVAECAQWVCLRCRFCFLVRWGDGEERCDAWPAVLRATLSASFADTSRCSAQVTCLSRRS